MVLFYNFFYFLFWGILKYPQIKADMGGIFILFWCATIILLLKALQSYDTNKVFISVVDVRSLEIWSNELKFKCNF